MRTALLTALFLLLAALPAAAQYTQADPWVFEEPLTSAAHNTHENEVWTALNGLDSGADGRADRCESVQTTGSNAELFMSGGQMIFDPNADSIPEVLLASGVFKATVPFCFGLSSLAATAPCIDYDGSCYYQDQNGNGSKDAGDECLNQVPTGGSTVTANVYQKGNGSGGHADSITSDDGSIATVAGDQVVVGDVQADSFSTNGVGQGAQGFVAGAGLTCPDPATAFPTVQGGSLCIDSANDLAYREGATTSKVCTQATGCSGGGSDTLPWSITIDALKAADAGVLEISGAGVGFTITTVGCNCVGTCSTPAGIQLTNRAGTAMTHTIPTCSTGTGSTTHQAVTAAGVVTAGGGVRFTLPTAPVPDATDRYVISGAMTIP